MFFPAGPLFFNWMNPEITSKEGKLCQRFPWKVGRRLRGLEQEVRQRSRNSLRLNCSQAKTSEEDEMKADLKKSLLGVAMRKQIEGLLRVQWTKRYRRAKKKKKKSAESGKGNENQLHGERDEGRGWKSKWKRKRLTRRPVA